MADRNNSEDSWGSWTASRSRESAKPNEQTDARFQWVLSVRNDQGYQDGTCAWCTMAGHRMFDCYYLKKGHAPVDGHLPELGEAFASVFLWPQPEHSRCGP